MHRLYSRTAGCHPRAGHVMTGVTTSHDAGRAKSKLRTPANIYGRASVYQAFYRARGKDYAEEARRVTQLIMDANPRAESLLDIACGPGTHLHYFAQSFNHTEGVEISSSMLDAAAANVPDVKIHAADMRDFRLSRGFDAVTCLFSSIGYMTGNGDLERAARAMTAHLRPGGVVVVEPWWFPDTFRSGWVSCDAVRAGEQTIVRVSQSVRVGQVTRMRAHWTVADAQNIEHFSEVHDIALFPRERYEEAFRTAGCSSVTYHPGEPAGRGLFVGRA